MTVKHIHKFVEAEYLKGNIKLLSVYINSKLKNDLECLECGYEWKACYDHFRSQNQGCPKCSGNIKLTQEFVENAYLKTNIKLLSIYVNASTKNNLECLEFGHKWEAPYNSFQNRNSGCPECWKLLNRGDNHPTWNHNLTDQERLHRDYYHKAENKKWREAVYNRDKATCQFCGSSISGTLNAHHIDAWSTHKSERFNVDNGVTLCETCHDACHAYHIHALSYPSATHETFYYWMNRECKIKTENWLWTVQYPYDMSKRLYYRKLQTKKI